MVAMGGFPGEQVWGTATPAKRRSPQSERTWTFMGHWENDTIVVDEVVVGQVEDSRIDDGRYEQGLWADSGTGLTVKEAEMAARAEYEDATFLVEITGEDEPEDFAVYADAVAAVDTWADSMTDDGWTVDRSWASRDNLYAAHGIHPQTGEERTAQVVKDES